MSTCLKNKGLNILRCLTYIVVLYFFSIVDYAQTWDALQRPMQGENSNGYGTALTITDETFHIVYVEIKSTKEILKYKQTAIPGNTWPSTSTTLLNTSHRILDSDMAVSGNTIHVVWTEEITSSDIDIYYSRSVDNGSTFSTPVVLCQSDRQSSSPAIAVVNDTVHVVWSDNRSSTGNIEIYYRRSVNSGFNWESEKNLTNTSDEYDGQLDISAQNQNIYIIWRSEDKNTHEEEIYFKRSVNGGQTWEVTDPITNNQKRKYFLRMVTVGKTLHVVYKTKQSVNNKDIVVYRRNDNAGLDTWTAPETIASTDSSIFGLDLSVNNQNLFLVWEDSKVAGYSKPDIYFKMSSDGGSSWGDEKNLYESTKLYSGNPIIDTEDNDICVSWYEEEFSEMVFIHGEIEGVSYRYNFSGHVYKGTPPDKDNSLDGVPIQLWGDDNNNPDDSPGTLIKEDATNSYGDFYIHSESAAQLYNYYHLIEIDPDGFTSTGAESGEPAGTVANESVITFEGSAMTVGNTYDNNFFWDETSGSSHCIFSGYVYEGVEPDDSHPISNAEVEVFGDENNDPMDDPGISLNRTMTNSAGKFTLTVNDEHPFYHVVEHDPLNYTSNSAAALPPANVFDPNIITWANADITPGSMIDEIAFWDEVPVSVDQNLSNTSPKTFTLLQNHPNPFNPETTIQFALPEAYNVHLTIYNIRGEKIYTLINSHMNAGWQSARWQGINDLGQKVSSGIYLYHLNTGNFQATKKLILMR